MKGPRSNIHTFIRSHVATLPLLTLPRFTFPLSYVPTFTLSHVPRSHVPRSHFHTFTHSTSAVTTPSANTPRCLRRRLAVQRQCGRRGHPMRTNCPMSDSGPRNTTISSPRVGRSTGPCASTRCGARATARLLGLDRRLAETLDENLDSRPTIAGGGQAHALLQAASSACRRCLTSSGTSSAKRRSAAVPGRGEYLNMRCSCTASARPGRASARGRLVSPQKPTMKSPASERPGTVSRARASSSSYCSTVYCRFIRRSTAFEPL